MVTIEQDSDAVLVTVRPGVGQAAYTSASLLDGSTKPIERIAAACHIDQHGLRYLEVEAGTPELGPTYRLHAVIDTGGQRRPAAYDVPGDQLVLVPNTLIGLYDDFEDDLGVWWAYPLLPLQRHLTARTTPAAGCVSATP